MGSGNRKQSQVSVGALSEDHHGELGDFEDCGVFAGVGGVGILGG
jgi:hypothetical protein